MEEERVKTSQDNPEEEEQGEENCLSRLKEPLQDSLALSLGVDRMSSAVKYQEQTPCINANRFITEMLLPFWLGKEWPLECIVLEQLELMMWVVCLI